MLQIDEEKLVKEPGYTYNDLRDSYPKIIDAYDRCRELEYDILNIKSQKVLESDYQGELQKAQRELFSQRQRMSTNDYNALKKLSPRRTNSFDYYEKALDVYCKEHADETVTDEGLSEIHTAAETLKEYLANMQMSLTKGNYNKFVNPIETLNNCGVIMTEKSITLLVEGFIDRDVAREAKLVSVTSAAEDSPWQRLSDNDFIKKCDPTKLDESRTFDQAIYQRAFDMKLDWGKPEVITAESHNENLRNVVFKGGTIKDSVFSFDDMTYSNLDNTQIVNSFFDRTELRASSITHSKLKNIDAYGCNIVDCDIIGTEQEGVNYIGCALENTSYAYSTLGTKEHPVRFGFGTDMLNVSFEGADLTNAIIEDVKNIHTVDFTEAKLPKGREDLEILQAIGSKEEPLAPNLVKAGVIGTEEYKTIRENGSEPYEFLDNLLKVYGEDVRKEFKKTGLNGTKKMMKELITEELQQQMKHTSERRGGMR